MRWCAALRWPTPAEVHGDGPRVLHDCHSFSRTLMESPAVDAGNPSYFIVFWFCRCLDCW